MQNFGSLKLGFHICSLRRPLLLVRPRMAPSLPGCLRRPLSRLPVGLKSFRRNSRYLQSFADCSRQQEEGQARHAYCPSWGLRHLPGLSAFRFFSLLFFFLLKPTFQVSGETFKEANYKMHKFSVSLPANQSSIPGGCHPFRTSLPSTSTSSLPSSPAARRWPAPYGSARATRRSPSGPSSASASSRFAHLLFMICPCG